MLNLGSVEGIGQIQSTRAIQRADDMSTATARPTPRGPSGNSEKYTDMVSYSMVSIYTKECQPTQSPGWDDMTRAAWTTGLSMACVKNMGYKSQ